MSLLIDTNTGDPIHHPKRRDVFEFDDEIAEIFENMAIRSIPMYAEMHRLFSKFAYAHHRAWKIRPSDFPDPYNYRILDIGASTGVALKMLWAEMGFRYDMQLDHTHVYSVDPSVPMLDKIKLVFPWMNCINSTAQAYLAPQTLTTKFDLVYASYTLQFVGSRVEQVGLLRRISEAMMDGGLFMLGHKENVEPHSTHMREILVDEYHYWRVDNGYTMEEITAKTKALANAMWPLQQKDMEHILEGLFSEVVPLTRWGLFSSYICRK